MRPRFPPDTIRLAVWLYFRFTTSLRDVEDLLAERGICVSYETVRCWANKFGPAITANIAAGADIARLERPLGANLASSVPRTELSSVDGPCAARGKLSW